MPQRAAILDECGAVVRDAHATLSTAYSIPQSGDRFPSHLQERDAERAVQQVHASIEKVLEARLGRAEQAEITRACQERYYAATASAGAAAGGTKRSLDDFPEHWNAGSGDDEKLRQEYTEARQRALEQLRTTQALREKRNHLKRVVGTMEQISVSEFSRNYVAKNSPLMRLLEDTNEVASALAGKLRALSEANDGVQVKRARTSDGQSLVTWIQSDPAA